MKTLSNFILLWVFIFVPQLASAQLVSVSGYVKNHVTGNAIKNASVFESVSGIGTISGDDGYYKLLLKPGEQDLMVTISGFETFSMNFRLTGDTTITVGLIPSDITSQDFASEEQSEKKSSKTKGKRLEEQQ